MGKLLSGQLVFMVEREPRVSFGTTVRFRQ